MEEEDGRDALIISELPLWIRWQQEQSKQKGEGKSTLKVSLTLPELQQPSVLLLLLL